MENDLLNTLGEDVKTTGIAEAGIYSALKLMWEEAEGGIESQQFVPVLSQSHLNDYFSTRDNALLLGKIVDVIQAGTNASMEAYAQIDGLNLLGIDSLSDAIRRNIDQGDLREKMTTLTNAGYALVFCPHDINADHVNGIFPIVDQWRDLVDTSVVVSNAVGRLDEIDGLDSYGGEFASAVIPKLIELSDRDTVSDLVFKHLGDTEGYSNFYVANGLVDDYSGMKDVSSGNEPLDAAITAFESTYDPSWRVRDLAEVVGEDDREYMSEKLGEWFGNGKMKVFTTVAGYEGGRLYDHEAAKVALTPKIIDASSKGELDRLDWLLEVPEYIIDFENPEMAGVASAYRIAKETESVE